MFFKCKMCGGDLLITDETGIATCEYCGSTQTVPKDNDDKRTNLFNRANRLRIASEFDKAAGIYESIIVDFPEESEAYWGICLCKYGIEYVDDPKTAKKIPTCHRTLYKSIFKDADFEQALEYADEERRAIYRSEAKEIDRIQKSIISIAQNEKPYDVFICYKETDSDGNRTKDSVIGQELYDDLVAKGFKVFFARISLEDKLGKEYEPYIFSALGSAKVMLVIGTSYDNLNAVWVKNEWSRFLDMMRSDKSKILVPCYLGIDAYDMPDEFKNLQGQDLSKLGAKQDIVRGICKILDHNTEPVSATSTTTVSTPDSGSEIKKYMERADIALDNHQWKEADGFFERVLEINPKNAYAYVGKLMAEMKVSELTELMQFDFDIENNNQFKNAMRFADGDLKRQLNGVKNTVNNIRFQRKQQRSKNLKFGVVIGIVSIVVVVFGILICNKVIIPRNTYKKACRLMESSNYEEAIKLFESLGTYNDSSSKNEECKRIISEMTEAEMLRKAGKGDVIKFGNYNGHSDWIVLDKDNDRLLIISKDAVEKKAFDSSKGTVWWKGSDLRKWLNDSYVNTAFSDKEKAMICIVNASEGDSVSERRWPSEDNTDDDNPTDFVFLLSIDGAKKYFTSNENRSIGMMWWLSLNISSLRKRIPYVQDDGTVNAEGFNAYYSGMGVRPAMWIDISNL